jgi:sugar lactone lactonase YvrE
VIARTEHEWGVELNGFGRPFGLGIDAHGVLHVTDMDRHCVDRFDRHFDYQDTLTAPGVWNGPHSVDFDAAGRLFVTCYYTPGIYVVEGHRRIKLDAAVSGPASAMFDTSGRLLVSEYSQNAVMAVHADGRLALTLSGSFDRPHMARALDDGSVIVADTWNNRLQRFTDQGALISDHVATVSCPVAIDPHPRRGWLVTAWGDNAVVRFDASGHYLGTLDTPPLEKPYDARWYGDDKVVVADTHHARVLILNVGEA